MFDINKLMKKYIPLKTLGKEEFEISVIVRSESCDR